MILPLTSNSSTLSDLNKKLDDYVRSNNLDMAVQYRCLDLVCEVGELSKEVLRSTQYGRAEFVTTDAWVDEFGDVVFALLCLASSTSTDIEEALNRTLQKYSERLAATGTVGSQCVDSGDEDKI